MPENTSKLTSTGYLAIELAEPRVTIQQVGAPGITGYTLGRSDPRSSYRPDVDLADFKALELGVSRRHAALVNHEDAICILDLDSVNGTFLNGERLQPDKPYPLYQETELRLGSLNLILRKVK